MRINSAIGRRQQHALGKEGKDKLLYWKNKQGNSLGSHSGPVRLSSTKVASQFEQPLIPLNISLPVLGLTITSGLIIEIEETEKDSANL